MFLIDESFISVMLGYVSSVFGDLKPLIWLILGLYLAFFILEYVIEIIRDRLDLRARLKEEHETRKGKVLAGILKPYKKHREEKLEEQIRDELFDEA